MNSLHRISIGPGDVAGYLGNLRKGFDALGIPCEHFMFIPPNAYNYEAPHHFLKRSYDKAFRLSERGKLGALAYKAFDKVIRLMALIYAIIKFDIFIFSGLGSFFRFMELPLLRVLGKTVIVVYLGSDARPPYLSGRHLDDQQGRLDPEVIALEARAIRKRMARVERFASLIVNHTGMAQFATRSFVRLCELGLPMQIAAELMPKPEMSARRSTVRILHAPSRPIAKGTLEARQAVEQMRSDGLAVELVELVGVANSEVLRNLADCDIVFDELYSDTAIATFAAEAALFGKPVVVGSLYAQHFGWDNPNLAVAPTTLIAPSALEETLRRLVIDADFRRSESERVQAFVSTEYTPEKVASRYYQLIKNVYPAEWIMHPDQVDYVGGWGLSVSAWRRQMSIYIAAVGEKGLYLEDRPNLRKKIMSAVAGSSIL